MDHFNYKNGLLHAEEIAIDTIAQAVETPFYCYSTATLQRHYTVFCDALDGLNATVCYAVKANSNAAIIATLARLGAGADVVSEGEIRLALKAGVPPERIVFSGVGKTPNEMRFALQQNIFQFNVESEPELRALNEVAAQEHTSARIAIRVNPDVDPKTHAKISTGNKETKFGVSILQAQNIYHLAATLPHIDVQGVSVHIGSQLTQLSPFEDAYIRVAELVRILRNDGHSITTLDLGGGLGIPYTDGSIPPPPAEYGALVKRTIGDLGCHLIFEPGRMIAGNAGILVTRILYVKDTGTRTFLILDAGMNDLMRPALYDAHHDIVPIIQPKSALTQAYDIVGPVCETGDIFAAQRPMPPLQAGDLLAIRSAGAYGAVMANAYNTRRIIPEVLVNTERFHIIHPRPTYEEMLNSQCIPGWL